MIHPPFDPPQSYLDRYNPEDLTPPLFRASDLERQKMFENVRAQTVKAANLLGYDKNEIAFKSG